MDSIALIYLNLRFFNVQHHSLVGPISFLSTVLEFRYPALAFDQYCRCRRLKFATRRWNIGIVGIIHIAYVNDEDRSNVQQYLENLRDPNLLTVKSSAKGFPPR